MTATPLETTGNSSKFLVTTSKHEEFTLALSFTLRTKIWQLAGAPAELAAAQELAEAIVSRHDPTLNFKTIYILGEHNTQPTLEATVKQLRVISIQPTHLL